MMVSIPSCVVIKIGGSTLGVGDTSLADVVNLHREGINPVLIHGGGSLISEWISGLQYESHFVDGLRVTDENALNVATAVLAGLINKNLIADVLALGGSAIGLSGVDGGMLRGSAGRPDLGFVATRLSVDPSPIQMVLSAGSIPIIAPLAVSGSKGSDVGNQILNVNADTVASDVAVALQASKLVFLTDVDGVMDQNGALIGEIDWSSADELIKSGVVSGGMIPKVEACVSAASEGIPSAIINGTRASELLEWIKGKSLGTVVI